MRNTCAPNLRIDPLCDRIRLCSPNSGTDANSVMGAEWNCLTHRCKDASPWAGISGSSHVCCTGKRASSASVLRPEETCPPLVTCAMWSFASSMRSAAAARLPPTAEPPPTPNVPQVWALAAATTAPSYSTSLVCEQDRSERLGSPSGEQDEDRAPSRNLRSSASKLDNRSPRHEKHPPPNNDRSPPRRPTRTVRSSTDSSSPVPVCSMSACSP